MKSYSFLLLLLLLFCFHAAVLAQADPIKFPARCGTDLYYEQLFQNNEALRLQFKMNQKMLARRPGLTTTNRVQGANDTITVVVHIVADSAVQALVTEAVIHSQLQVLNEDYEGRNADSTRIPAHFKPLFGKSGIVFQLARTNPYGEPTDGITRKLTNITYNTNTADQVKFDIYGGENAWNPEQYLNIWIVNFGKTGLLGISVFPGDPRPLTLHGFICDYRAFGRGFPYLDKLYNKGRTTTHELGHFFNLVHTWGDNNGSCTGTDFPGDSTHDDTPNQTDATYGNPDPAGIGVVLTDACSPVAPGIMYQNYMDYCDDSVMVMFTKGQQYRMNNALSLSPDRTPLLISTAFHPATIYVRDARVLSILQPTKGSSQCSTIAPKVILRNSGTDTLTAVQIMVALNGAAPVLYKWTGSLPAYTQAIVTLPGITAPVGENTIAIYTQNPNNTPDENAANDTTVVTYEVPPILSLNGIVKESFDSPQFPPPNWRIDNPDNDLTWERNATVGNAQPGSAWVNDYNNPTNNRYDDLITPTYSFQALDSLFLSFNIASVSYSDPNTQTIPIDTLSVLVSKDCGNSYTTVYKKWGRELQTTGTPDAGQSTEFFPGLSQWRRDSVNIGRYLSSTESQLGIAFRFSGNYENNLFIDDITLKPVILPAALKQKGFLFLPSPFHDQFGIWHYKQPTTLKSITIFNSSGQLVWKRAFDKNADKFITVNLQHQSAGVYIVHLEYSEPGHQVSERILKY